LTAGYEIPKIAVTAATNFMGLSGAPYAPQALVSLPQGRRSVNIEEAGAYRLPAHTSLSLRFSKFLFRSGERRLELIAHVSNLLQEDTYTAVVSRNYFATTFGQGDSWVEPRKMYFQVRVLY
jgi:hypothetical protein